MAYASENRVVGLDLGHRFQLVVENLKAAAEKRKVYTDTVRELSALTNAELADIGLSRANIRAAAYEAAYGA